MEKYICIRFGRKSGKIDKTLEGISSAMLRLWALQNTPKTKDTIIFCLETGNIVFYCEGNESGFPKVHEDMEKRNIEDLCPGLLEVMQKGE